MDPAFSGKIIFDQGFVVDDHADKYENRKRVGGGASDRSNRSSGGDIYTLLCKLVYISRGDDYLPEKRVRCGVVEFDFHSPIVHGLSYFEDGRYVVG